jgi:hypothetical protein
MTIVRIPTTSYFISTSAFNTVTKALLYQNMSLFALTPLPFYIIPSANALPQHSVIAPIGAPVTSQRCSHSMACCNEAGGDGLPQCQLMSLFFPTMLRNFWIFKIKEAIASFGSSYFYDTDIDGSLDRVIEVIMLKFINEV